MEQALVIDVLLHEGGVVVFRGNTAGGATVRCVAARDVMRPPAPGESWAVHGRWQAHPVHGPQLGVEAAVLSRPSGRLFVQAVARNVRDFPGIGAVRARAVWDAHGADVFDRLDAGDPQTFAPQLGAELAAVLVAGWRAGDHEAQAYRWLTHHGFPPALAAKVIRIYAAVPIPGEHRAAAARVGPVVWHLEDDPYRMLAFAGWRAVDAAARRLGVAADDVRRLSGAAEAACARGLARGHTWVAAGDLAAGAARLLGAPAGVGAEAVRLAAQRGAVRAHAGGYQPPGAYVMERYVAARLAAIAAGREAPAQRRLDFAPGRPAVEAVLDRLDATQAHPLTAEQRAAVWMAVTEPLSLLLGGPGVGKTTVLRAVHAVCAAQGRAVHQAALAGRAAARLRKATGRPAYTVAGLLAATASGDVVLDDEPLVIVDEGSMVDLGSTYRLLARFPPGAQLLLVGDPGQLPPVGFGLVFHVLAAADGAAAVPRTTLTLSHRATAASGIPAACEAIRRGVVPPLEAPDWSRPGGVGFVAASPAEVTARVLDVLAHTARLGGAQVVGSLKDGPGGVAEINRWVQSLRAVGRTQLNGRFYAGDPVLVTRNDHDLGVLNGDLGVALGNAEGGGLRCRFDDGEKVLPAQTLAADADLAYAITCHKAQGSQFPIVVVPVTPDNPLLDRTLLLTAVSRAQRQVVLVGDRRALAAAVEAPPSPDRRRVGLGRGDPPLDDRP